MELQELLEPKCCLFLQQNNILIKLIFISRSGFFFYKITILNYKNVAYQNKEILEQ